MLQQFKQMINQKIFLLYRSSFCFFFSLCGLYFLCFQLNKSSLETVINEIDYQDKYTNALHALFLMYILLDIALMSLVRQMWRRDLFLHHCVVGLCTIVVGGRYPLGMSICYLAEIISVLNPFRSTYPLTVFVWRAMSILFVRAPLFWTIWYVFSSTKVITTNVWIIYSFVVFFVVHDLYVLTCLLSKKNLNAFET